MASPRHVIDLGSPDSPHQNNAEGNRSAISVGLPDLASILAGFNKPSANVDAYEDEPAITDEQRDFGQSLAHLNHRLANGTVIKMLPRPRKSKSTANSKDPKPPRERKPRVTNPKVAKEPKPKALKKKPMTITARSLSAFANPIAGQTEMASTPARETITKFLSCLPASENLSSATIKPTTPAPRTKPKPKVGRTKLDKKACLLPAETVISRLKGQRVLYQRNRTMDHAEPLPLKPSALITLAKGHWRAGNRGPDNGLTDGGPSEIYLNQEQAVAAEDEDTSRSKILPIKYCDQFLDISDRSCEENSSCTEASPSANERLRFMGTQEYLREIVGDSGSDLGIDNFPVSPTALNLRSDIAKTTFKECLETPGAAERCGPRSVVPIGGKRVRSQGSLNRRNVSPKLERYASPGEASDAGPVSLSIDAGDVQNDNGARQDSPLPSDMFPLNLVDSEVTQPFNYALPPEVIDLATSDDDSVVLSRDSATTSELSRSQKGSREIDRRPNAYTKAQHDISAVGLPSPRINLVVDSCPSLLGSPPLADEIAHNQQEEVPSSFSKHSRTLRPWDQKDEEGFWIVPDSEDEIDLVPKEIPSTSPDKPSSTLMPSQPNFNGYTTAQLQTQLSKYGFKASKNRQGMIGLLDQCWQANTFQSSRPVMQQVALHSTKASACTSDLVVLDSVDQSSSALKVKAPRKPRESAAIKAERLALEKQAKLEARALLAQEKALKKAADAEAKKLQKTMNKEALELYKIESVKTLFKDLTTLLRSKDGHVWWIRILKYEPIILEDFTDWLKTAKEIETDADTIRDYFDSKGICCVKKVTRKGKDRRRL